MTPLERSNLIAQTLYMGEIPDVWVALAQVVVIRHIREAEQEVYRKCAEMADMNIESYPDTIASKIRQSAEEANK